MGKLWSRVDQLEKMSQNRLSPPMYCRSNQTRKEAEQGYLQRYGFKLPDNAKVVQYVRIATRKTNNG